MGVVTGLDRVANDPSVIGGRQWALLANHAAVTRDLIHARVLLGAGDAGPPRRLFAPEHGLDGVAQDMEPVSDHPDPLTGVPVRSLYGSAAATLDPGEDDLDGVDALVVDLPDIGTRHYTFAATMDAAMAACAHHGVTVIVLDRPNPIGGVEREGGLVEPGCESFVSRLPTPVRHGLTLGELALLLRRERHRDLELTVVACSGWRRADWGDETGLPWVPPSPNMPTLETAGLYPGLCLVEATMLSEGRGTTRPFHLVGAPWVDPDRLVARLADQDLAGVAFRAARFRPEFQKHAGEVCGGVEIHVTDRSALRPLAVGLGLLKAVHDLHPAEFAWRQEAYEFECDVPAIDLLTGSDAARRCIEGGEPLAPLLDRWRAEVSSFEERLGGILLYHV